MLSSFLVGTALADSSLCDYGTATEEQMQEVLECASTKWDSTVTELTACDADDQEMLEAGIAAGLWSNCKAVYYYHDLAFYWQWDDECFLRSEKADNGRGWSTWPQWFYTSGGLDTALNEICNEPAQAPPNGCVDDPAGKLARIPITCTGSVLRKFNCGDELTGGHAWLFPGETVDSLCPASCLPECQTSESDDDALICTDDPDGELAATNTDCESLLEEAGSCLDENDIMNYNFGGTLTVADLCPASCHPDCL